MAPFSKKIEDCVESLFHVVVSPSATLYSFALSDTFTLKQKEVIPTQPVSMIVQL